jgi:PAS domain S-box-containing protein
MGSTAEIKRLQSCINDLISVLALPAIWSGSESSQILGTLLDVLLTMLRLDFAFARLSGASDGAPIDVVRSGQHRHASVQPQQFGQALDRWLMGDQTAWQCVVPSPVGEGGVSIASFSLGLQDEVGVLVAGSRRGDFPTEVEGLLLRVAANQAGIGLQEARRSGEQKRIAEMLEQRVAERTRQLTAVNDDLRRSEAYLAEAQRLSHTGSFGWRPSTGEILWSEETFRVFQYDRTTNPTVELILQRVHPEDAALVQQTIERAARDGKDFDHEYRLVMPDGSIKCVHVVAHALSDESDGIEFVGAVMDVTAAKHAEQTLRESEAYLAEAQRLAHTGSGAWRVPGGDAMYLSEEWYRIYGFDPKQGLSAWKDRLPRMHPEDRAKVREIKDRAISEKSDYELDHRILLPDGTVKYTHTVGHPVLNASGDVERFVCTMMDVTERKQAEEGREALRQAQADLARVSRVTTMAELTASLAHDVNQPIAAASSDANTCLRWLAGDTPNIEEARATAMRIVKDVKRAGEIISRIRQLFKKGTSQRELVDVNEIIREMMVLLRGETTRYNILVGTDLAADLPQVMADRVQLQQVLMNLMINGIEAMKDADRTRELTIKSRRAETDQVLVSVNDTGVGLPPQQTEEQIFKAFFTTKPQGTGMGRALVYLVYPTSRLSDT